MMQKPDSKPNILVLGASGVFGSRLVELLGRETDGFHLTLAGRRRAPLEKLAAGRSDRCVMPLNRDDIGANDLADFDMVIDAAGPFQASHMQVVRAAIKAGCHYIDLADGREFVRDIRQFDVEAKKADIAVISGASSIPALSHAAVDYLTAGWQQIDSIRIGIFPGNRAPRGRAVVESILSYAGKPVEVFRNGEWQRLPGWGKTHRVDLPVVGKRWASICDTPDQDLLVERYQPLKDAEFFAGLELSILHLGLSALTMPVRWGLLPTLRPASGILLWLAERFLPFGSDKGAMDISVSGRRGSGEPLQSRWILQADANRGPYVPIFAALSLARRLRDGRFPWRGAMPCAGMLTLDEFMVDIAAMGMKVCRQ